MEYLRKYSSPTRNKIILSRNKFERGLSDIEAKLLFVDRDNKLRGEFAKKATEIRSNFTLTLVKIAEYERELDEMKVRVQNAMVP